MTEEEWQSCPDTFQLYEALPQPVSHRRLRLWAIACGRRLVSPSCPTSRYEQYRSWLASPRWELSLAAAEQFADGELDRTGLRAARVPEGGPYNMFLITAGIKHFTHRAALGSIRGCGNEFGAPSVDEQATLFRDIFGNPFRPVSFSPSWRTDTALTLARQMYDSRDFGAMPILADALQDAGCEDEHILNHSRDASQIHVRGCWVVDLVLGKE
jgi:hypothetical protein